MSRLRALLSARHDRDSGMTLIEVVVAIGILGLLSTLSLGFYMTSMESATTHQRREIAITVANESMEILNGWTPNLAALTSGRSQTNVLAQWATPVSGLANTYQVWDDVPVAATEAIPISRTVVRSGTEFTVVVYIGTCYKRFDSSECTKLPSATPPAVPPSGTAHMVRAIVDVRWTAGTSCATTACRYSAATLIDVTGSDLEWITTGAGTP
ncbi:type IV pilus modification PilV family protein [Salinibacterium hongtaonis]|uniref:Prepilin-type N-terminal cleavage/methylation domain-containing protein n=1 Tax=Homoserinimonas hongtaonis TaxID=2079791 RepID=A0A2U1T0R7_9MICO|nr:prepilin-type N-terminal cleavage/methylation domain-containing protein [Salinibacterium hongtaonis]PWB97474.1 hypothetical protein DF220_06245 [Salinibacterium hongtaonis]